MRLFTTAAAVSLALAGLQAEARSRPAAKIVWQAPQCTVVSGTGAVTFTRDDGATLAPTSEVAQPVAYTHGLVASDIANRLYALHGTSLLRSDDAGCTWGASATVTGWDYPPYLLAGAGGRLYGWSDNRQFFFRIEDDAVAGEKIPVGPIAGLGIDPGDGERLRIAGTEGALADSFDGGRNWELLQGEKPPAAAFYRIVFDPHHLDHIVAGSLGRGAFVSFNGGRSWTQALGLGDQHNVFSIAISPADANVVWARAINAAGEPPANRHLYRSTDGGLTFQRVLSDSAEMHLVNQPLLVAHPADANVLYFVFGTYFQGYGTDIFRYDAALDQLTKTHNDYDEIVAIAFNPADPSVMYLGIAEER
jgi:hypothetical protein